MQVDKSLYHPSNCAGPDCYLVPSAERGSGQAVQAAAGARVAGGIAEVTEVGRIYHIMWNENGHYSIRRLPISFGMALRLREKCKNVAAELKDKTSLFVLGKGYGEPIGKQVVAAVVVVVVLPIFNYYTCSIWRRSEDQGDGLHPRRGIQRRCLEARPLRADRRPWWKRGIHSSYHYNIYQNYPLLLHVHIIALPPEIQGQTPVIMVILDDDHAMHMRTAAEEVRCWTMTDHYYCPFMF